MPTGKSFLDLNCLYFIDKDGVGVEIGELNHLTLDQEQDSDPVWEIFRENMEFTITAEWYMRSESGMVYLFRKRRQRKTALEKRKRRAKNEQGNKAYGVQAVITCCPNRGRQPVHG